jgi:serine/threonine protein kinase
MDPFGQQFAVKQVAALSTAVRGNGQLDALQNEMRLYRDLCHPNIVRCYGMVVFDGTANIILELAPMGTVAKVVRQLSSAARSGEHGGLTLGVARNYLSQILAGLEYLHVRGVVHRDLKCDNVLVDANGHCKLADFGAAKSLAHVLYGNHHATLCGTPEWLAPEAFIASGSKFDWKKSDVWSLGCTLIEMLTAVSPWHQYLFETPGLYVEDSTTILFLLKKKYKIGELPSGLLHCADGARDFLGRCLQVDPSCRPSTTELCADPFIAGL